MAVRPIDLTCLAVKRPFIVQTSASVTAGYPVVLGTAETDVLNATSNQKAIGIALESGSAGETVQIALFGYAIVPCKVGTGGATHGEYAIVSSSNDGLTNQTLGGGTTVKYVAGRFMQTGAAGDMVGLLLGNFASGAA